MREDQKLLQLQYVPNGIPGILYPQVVKQSPSIHHTQRQLNIKHIQGYGRSFNPPLQLSFLQSVICLKLFHQKLLDGCVVFASPQWRENRQLNFTTRTRAEAQWDSRDSVPTGRESTTINSAPRTTAKYHTHTQLWKCFHPSYSPLLLIR